MLRTILNLYIINGIKIAEEVGSRPCFNNSSVCFLTISGILPVDKAIELMKAKATAKFSKKGDAIVAANHNGIERGSKELVKVEVPASWKDAVDEEIELEVKTDRPEMKKFVKEILDPVGHRKGRFNPCFNIC